MYTLWVIAIFTVVSVILSVLHLWNTSWTNLYICFFPFEDTVLYFLFLKSFFPNTILSSLTPLCLEWFPLHFPFWVRSIFCNPWLDGFNHLWRNLSLYLFIYCFCSISMSITLVFQLQVCLIFHHAPSCHPHSSFFLFCASVQTLSTDLFSSLSDFVWKAVNSIYRVLHLVVFFISRISIWLFLYMPDLWWNSTSYYLFSWIYYS